MGTQKTPSVAYNRGCFVLLFCFFTSWRWPRGSLPVTNEDAYALGREMGQVEGLLVGISAGAALWAAIELAKQPENQGKTIVALLPDTGDRYLSTPMFQG